MIKITYRLCLSYNMIILFLNHKVEACGVYQYGLRVSNILKKSNKNTYIYSGIDNYDSYVNCLSKHNHDIIIYNYHLATMPWLNSNNIQKTVKNVVIPHETPCDFFDYIFSIDPDEIEINNIYNIPRPIYENVEDLFSTYKIKDNLIENFINYNEGPDVPIFGSFGFGFQNKGFDKIIDVINQNYTNAIVKLVITLAHFDPNNNDNYNIINNLCKLKNVNPNIKLLICNNFFTNEEILLFLHSNTANIFLYDELVGRGISSVIDYAISVNKPFVISDSQMFRHIYSDSICVYKTNIKDAIINSKYKSLDLIYKYSNQNLIDKIETIIDFIVNKKEFVLTNNEIELRNKFINTITAYYYDENNNNGNVTHILFELYKKYKYEKIDNFSVSNNTFFDTQFGIVKKLYINIHNNNNNNNVSPLVFNENEIAYWNDIDKYINFDNINNIDNTNNQMNTNLIEVSIGEIIDKYSILELKLKYIADNCVKIKEIQKEMNVLEKFVENIKNSYFYKLLLFINEEIWLDTDNIKQMTYMNKPIDDYYRFSQISNNIFENNQKRFRLKNYFNILNNSNIKEEKSYYDNICFLEISKEEVIYEKIPEINYLCISYDIIYITHKFKDVINKLFKNTNIYFVDSQLNINEYHHKILNTYTIDERKRNYFDFEPTAYLSGGKLGDFLNQLSVICEKYYETGKKGILYIYNIPEYEFENSKFTFELEETYKDTYNNIKNLTFIKDYKLYNNEKYDIHLSKWRNNLSLDNFFNIYFKNYNVSWGKHPWLKANFDNEWSNKILINVTPYRFITENVISTLKKVIYNNINDVVFISNEKEHYDYFSQKLNINIKYYKPMCFGEVVTIVNSCKMAYLGMSSMQVIANSLHKNHIIIGNNSNGDIVLNNIKGIMPHVIDILF